ncbi:M48 family metalloprotease [Nostoc sp. DSM 114161]|jgi:tetratricopeptide (TPR) repeat protein
MNEYEADRCAADLTGEENTAETLINVEVKARFIERYFWSGIYKQVETEIEPPKMTYTAMKQALSQRLHQEITSIYLMEALTQKTNNADTHPCLADRLKALKYISNAQEEAIFPAVETSAAQKILDINLENFIEYLSQAWREEIAAPWRQKYIERQNSLATLKDLNNKLKKQQLTPEGATERAFLTFNFEGEEAAIPLLKEIIHLEPRHTSANYLLGQILIKQQNAAGIEYIEKAIAEDSYLVLEGYKIIYFFLQKQGKVNEAKSYLQRAENYYDLICKARQERSDLREKDEFEPHNISDIEVNKVREQLSCYPHILSAYLCKKNLQYFPEKPLYVLAVKREFSWLEGNHEADNSKLANSLLQEIEIPGNIFIFILNSHLNMEKKLKQIPNSMIYNKKGKK